MEKTVSLWDCPGMNLALCAEKLATNCLSYDMAEKYLQ
jgi:hypothetical protein